MLLEWRDDAKRVGRAYTGLVRRRQARPPTPLRLVSRRAHARGARRPPARAPHLDAGHRRSRHVSHPNTARDTHCRGRAVAVRATTNTRLRCRAPPARGTTEALAARHPDARPPPKAALVRGHAVESRCRRIETPDAWLSEVTGSSIISATLTSYAAPPPRPPRDGPTVAVGSDHGVAAHTPEPQRDARACSGSSPIDLCAPFAARSALRPHPPRPCCSIAQPSDDRGTLALMPTG